MHNGATFFEGGWGDIASVMLTGSYKHEGGATNLLMLCRDTEKVANIRIFEVGKRQFFTTIS